MHRDYKDSLARQLALHFSELENRILSDIIRRIKKTGEITSTADWQINRLRDLGKSAEEIESAIKDALGASYPEMFELYDKVLEKEYTRNKEIYEQVNAKYVAYEDNGELQQKVEGLIEQTKGELENMTQSLGFYVDYGNGRRVMTPLSQIYGRYLDAACMDILSGAFDYSSVIKRTVTQLTNSGLRTIDYASGVHARVEVAARRSLMTGISQLTGKIADMQARDLKTDYFEVAWHAGARPEHATWQGKVWSRKQLYSVCGLGTVTGLLGANCYHEYYPFFPGISERTWTDEWLQEQNARESSPKEFMGKEYTAYQARQRQRQLELAMRVQRQKIRLMEEAKADPMDIMLMKCRYQGQMDEYVRFSRKMGLKQERERIYVDSMGLVGDLSPKERRRYPKAMVENAEKDRREYEKVKDIIGKEIGSIASFRWIKYTDYDTYSILRKKVSIYSEIDEKKWSLEFKQKSKDAYDRFSKEGIYMSSHALSRLSRLSKSGFAEVTENELVHLLKKEPNYKEGGSRIVYFDKEKQIGVLKSTITGEIVTILRRKNAKEEWMDV